jgi:RNA polymerase sigma factor (sigma-70 family)
MSSQLSTDSNDAKQTLEIVWNQHGDQLRRRARTRLRQYGLTGQTESMDICNDVMADLARRGPRPTTPDEILAYILRAIDNQVLDTFRKLASQCRDFRRNEAAPVEELRISAEMTTPSQISIRREIMDRLRASLPAEEVLAVDMMLENRDWHEIGDAIGMKPDAARMKVRRAIERIREQMARQTVDE